MDKITPSLNMLRPERSFMLKYLDAGQRGELERLVLSLTPAQYNLLVYGWGIDDGDE